jgi:CheY-like chemotaxis protein
MRILVAEDDRVHNRLIEKHLKARGYEVCTAFDASEAWLAIERCPADLILLDVHMPGGTGLGFLKKLRHSSDFREIPVIVITASEDPLVLRMTEMHDPVAIFSKPVDFLLLDQSISSCQRPAPGRGARLSGL